MRFPLLITLAALLLAGCANLNSGQDAPKVDVAGIESLPGLGMELRLAVKLRVINPSDNPINFDGLFVDMDVEGKSFASGVSDQKGQVPRYGEAVVTVPVTISAIAMARQLIGFTGKSKTAPLTYEIRGKLAGPAFSAHRFAMQGEFNLPTGSGSQTSP